MGVWVWKTCIAHFCWWHSCFYVMSKFRVIFRFFWPTQNSKIKSISNFELLWSTFWSICVFYLFIKKAKQIPWPSTTAFRMSILSFWKKMVSNDSRATEHYHQIFWFKKSDDLIYTLYFPTSYTVLCPYTLFFTDSLVHEARAAGLQARIWEEDKEESWSIDH